MRKLVKRIGKRTVAWYVLLELIGVMMYIVAAVYAYHQRGYFAIGGEVIAFLLPVVYYFVDKTIWAVWDAWKGAREDGAN